MSAYFLIYSSYATAGNDHFFKRLLEQAREKNRTLNITGMLLYLNGMFVQLIEGEKNVVRALYHSISQDHRHAGPVVLMEGNRKEGYFKEWSMGFKAVSAQEIEGEDNYRSLNSPSKENLGDKLRVFRLLSDRSASPNGATAL